MTTVEEFAARLDGRQYGNEMTAEEEKLAKELDFLVVFGASDDLAELRGAIDDECGCFNGGVLKLENGHCPPIKAVWCPEGRNCSWAYETKLPHAEFRIMEGDEVYCYGIVCSPNDSAAMAQSPETFPSEAPDTTTVKFKPVCERCGYTLSSLSLHGREWHFEPFSCPRCGRRIVSAEFPRIEAGEIDYSE